MKKNHAQGILYAALSAAFLLILAMSTTFFLYMDSRQAIDKAQLNREQTLQLADELRQTSDDLTRMVRTYVVTGNTMYKQQFQEVLDIRDGLAPRPENYPYIYWDLVLEPDKRPRPASTSVKLTDLMRQANVTNEELHLLSSAKENSDTLVKLERQAMALRERAEPHDLKTHLQAIDLVHSKAYQEAKVGIMLPILNFTKVLDERTQLSVQRHRQTAARLQHTLTVLALLLVLTIALTAWVVHRILGASLSTLEQHISSLSNGTCTESLIVPRGLETSIAGCISRAQKRLIELDIERTQQQTELKKAEHSLMESERLSSLGALVAGVAHELNTPIGIAVTAASALEANTKDIAAQIKDGKMLRSTFDNYIENCIETAPMVLRACQRAANLIASFKNISIDQTSEQRRFFMLHDVANDHITMLRTAHKHVKWAFENTISPKISCDSYPGALGQVISNLLNNAAIHAFTPTDSGTITISAETENEDVIIYVTDNGKGMSEAILARIWQPFFTTKFGTGGSGLGLAICHNIAVGILKGSLKATSTEGQGTCFTLRIPLFLNGNSLG
ncbi:sensor histidine kinase [Shewanella baltica]|uniref:sensor histidine kinase n=1 Tax=Shewanella baltica TaxID=62322 RepID=UPI00217F2195|nr:HAMP domain-containing sensor histidine kinase [Shewanella baltica]MCS6234923.1 HAMP domain-containing histidine kinase [Shewanella baltica]MCS6260031.1 HAMP domain-containing histidine kinase [Shewanella baltica]MCS6269405.1 HAMP domain-containing histidine kinase [Shewanella baltica]